MPSMEIPGAGHARRSLAGRLLATALRPGDETKEQFVRRVDRSPVGSFIGRFIRPLVPSVVELYDRIEELEQRVLALEQDHFVVTPEPDHGSPADG